MVRSLAALLVTATAHGATPPVPVSPAPQAELHAHAGLVTFAVRARAHERRGSLRIQIADPRPRSDHGVWFKSTGSDPDVSDISLMQAAPGSTRWLAGFNAADLNETFGDARLEPLVWHVLRSVGGRNDISPTRRFEWKPPRGYAWGEQYHEDNHWGGAADLLFPRNCQYLEAADDVDWFRFSTTKTRTVRFIVHNDAGQGMPSSRPLEGDPTIGVSIFAEGSRAPLLDRTIARHRAHEFRVRLRGSRTYEMSVAHAARGRAAVDVRYRFWTDLPGLESPGTC